MDEALRRAVVELGDDWCGVSENGKAIAIFARDGVADVFCDNLND